MNSIMAYRTRIAKTYAVRGLNSNAAEFLHKLNVLKKRTTFCVISESTWLNKSWSNHREGVLNVKLKTAPHLKRCQNKRSTSVCTLARYHTR